MPNALQRGLISVFIKVCGSGWGGAGVRWGGSLSVFFGVVEEPGWEPVNFRSCENQARRAHFVLVHDDDGKRCGIWCRGLLHVARGSVFRAVGWCWRLVRGYFVVKKRGSYAGVDLGCCGGFCGLCGCGAGHAGRR